MALYDIKGRDALTSTSSASGMQDAGWMQGDFNVNYGSGSLSTAASGAPVPSWVWLAGVALVGVWVWKRRR